MTTHQLSRQDIDKVMETPIEKLLVSSVGPNIDSKRIKLIVDFMRGFTFVVTICDKEIYRGLSFYDAADAYNSH